MAWKDANFDNNHNYVYVLHVFWMFPYGCFLIFKSTKHSLMIIEAPLLQNISTIYKYENDIFIGTMSSGLEQCKGFEIKSNIMNKKNSNDLKKINNKNLSLNDHPCFD
jgi:hypothetical protein